MCARWSRTRRSGEAAHSGPCTQCAPRTHDASGNRSDQDELHERRILVEVRHCQARGRLIFQQLRDTARALRVRRRAHAWPRHWLAAHCLALDAPERNGNGTENVEGQAEATVQAVQYGAALLTMSIL